MRSSKLIAVASLAALGGLAMTAGAWAKPDPKVDAEFKKMDSNHDGRISAEEHAAGAKKMFDAMDANHDGKVTADEMTATQRKVTGAAPKPGDMSSADKIKAIDSDGDGVLTAAEHAAGSKTMFERMDSDKDGFLSKGELAAGHAKLMPKSGG